MSSSVGQIASSFLRASSISRGLSVSIAGEEAFSRKAEGIPYRPEAGEYYLSAGVLVGIPSWYMAQETDLRVSMRLLVLSKRRSGLDSVVPPLNLKLPRTSYSASRSRQFVRFVPLVSEVHRLCLYPILASVFQLHCFYSESV